MKVLFMCEGPNEKAIIDILIKSEQLIYTIDDLLDLTRREQEIPLFYKWWDELRLTRRFLDFWGLLYYNIFINQSYLTERV